MISSSKSLASSLPLQLTTVILAAVVASPAPADEATQSRGLPLPLVPYGAVYFRKSSPRASEGVSPDGLQKRYALP